ncbi:MAG: DUF554 domain-containing protein [Planctomycetaceae bacterium]|nr:DUF554 domain-containing protein [Planctomycetaceae bacterium]
MIIATLINVATVLLGGVIGLLFRGKIPKNISENVIRAIGLAVCVIGVTGAAKGDIMLLVTSMALGTFVGELLHIEDGLNRFGLWLQEKLSRDDNSTFAEGFVTATLLFCVGTMTIIGSIESGLNNDQTIIKTKSVLDGVSSMFLSSTLGFGVLFSAGVILVYQGGLEFFAGYLKDVLTEPLITQVSATGSVMILGIGLNMTLKAKLRVANLLPGLVVAAGYYCLFLR